MYIISESVLLHQNIGVRISLGTYQNTTTVAQTVAVRLVLVGVVGGANYIVGISIDGQRFNPELPVTISDNPALLLSRSVVLLPGETLLCDIIGDPADVDVGITIWILCVDYATANVQATAAAQLVGVLGAVAGKVYRNPAGTQIKFYALDGALLSTLSWDASTNTWDVLWA